MHPTPHTPATYQKAIINRLQTDMENNRQYLKICRSFIEQADADHDPETLQFWAHQQDRTLQSLRAINQQLKTM